MVVLEGVPYEAALEAPMEGIPCMWSPEGCPIEGVTLRSPRECPLEWLPWRGPLWGVPWKAYLEDTP